MEETIKNEAHHVASTYASLPVVLTKAKGVHAWDQNGKQYIDCMSAYSAVTHGHCHPRIIDTISKQIQQLAVVSRAYHTPTLGPFLKRACELTGMDKGIPMNSGTEAVEVALKAARRWGYEIKGIPENKAEIIVCNENFHGRTISVISFSTEASYKKNFGPFTPGFKAVPFGDSKALSEAITENTAAFLIEPMQGESGIHIPPKGYLADCAKICREHNVLFIADEIQVGLGRTGKILACEHDNVKPDGVILGKALGGGVLPISLFLARSEIMDLFVPGTHGSTFGGNELSAKVGLEALNIIVEDKLAERAEQLGQYFLEQLLKINSPLIKEVRGIGLFMGLEINSEKAEAHKICLQLLENGVLSKDTHGTVIRLAPPLIISKEEIDEVVTAIKKTLSEVTR